MGDIRKLCLWLQNHSMAEERTAEEESSGLHLVQHTCSNKISQTPFPRTTSRSFWVSPQPPWASCARAQSLLQSSSVSQCSDRTLCVTVWAYCLFPATGNSWKEPSSVLFTPSLSGIHKSWRVPSWPLPSPGWTIPGLSGFPEMPLIIAVALLWILSTKSMLLLYWCPCTEEHRTGHSTPGVASAALTEES